MNIIPLYFLSHTLLAVDCSPHWAVGCCPPCLIRHYRLFCGAIIISPHLHAEERWTILNTHYNLQILSYMYTHTVVNQFFLVRRWLVSLQQYIIIYLENITLQQNRVFVFLKNNYLHTILVLQESFNTWLVMQAS